MPNVTFVDALESRIITVKWVLNIGGHMTMSTVQKRLTVSGVVLTGSAMGSACCRRFCLCWRYRLLGIAKALR